ncbi:MAG: hypothetical protein WAZ18_01495 [Alphaproteobacteria bacterium]
MAKAVQKPDYGTLEAMKEANFKIYQGVICLELQTPEGRHWWAQGYGLGFAPCRLEAVAGFRAGLLEDTRRRVLAARVEVEGQMRWVAVNAPRSDIPALEALGVWPAAWPKPYETVTYAPWPRPLP